MTHEKHEVWGTQSRRRTLAFTRPDARHLPSQDQGPMGNMTGSDLARLSVEASAASAAYGPEATARAREMEYELTRRIQQESPYAPEVVIEHRVHDYRLYVGMWIVAGMTGVSAFLTYSLWQALITVVAVAFALTSSPGRQYDD